MWYYGAQVQSHVKHPCYALVQCAGRHPMWPYAPYPTCALPGFEPGQPLRPYPPRGQERSQRRA